MKRVVSVLMITAIALAFAGCGKENINIVSSSESSVAEPKAGADLIGKWVSVEDPKRYYIFKKDGTGMCYGNEFTYRMEGSKSFKISIYAGDFSFVYNIEDDTLTMRPAYDNTEYKYRRDDTAIKVSEVDENIVGIWVNNINKELVIFRNGVADYDGNPINVYTHDGLFYLVDDGETLYYYYEVKDNVMTITDEAGESLIFTHPTDKVTLENLIGDWYTDDNDIIRITSSGRFLMGYDDEYLFNFTMEQYGNFIRAYIPDTDDSRIYIFNFSGDDLIFLDKDKKPAFVYHRKK